MSNANAVEALFFAALEKGIPAEQAAYLESACRGDAELRRQVEKLLKAHPRMGDFLQKPVVEQLDSVAGLASDTEDLDASTDGRCEASALGFLQPSTRPGSLGRIGHYEVLEVLGRGGFSIVFRAFDEVLQRVVAVKVLAPELAVSSPPRKRFLREARSSAKVRHDNVVQVYAIEEQPLPYLVMELVPGETLQQRLDRTGPLETLEIVQIGRQIAEGLAAAHATGLIHRDIKPGNILIEAGPVQRVRLTDFGLARAADDASLSQSGIIAGTPMFMAPEQASGEALDHRADLFSLGSVLYTMCTGRPPFRAKTALAVLKRVAEETPRPIPEIIPEVPSWLCDLIARLHAKKPEDRFASAREVADLLARHLEQMQHPGNVEAPPVARPAIGPRFRTGRWAIAAALFLMLLGVLGFTDAAGVTDVRGTVIRLFSPEGTLVIEVDDPGVSVTLDGSELVITGAGIREIRLKPGRYTVEASKDGKLVRRELVTVTKKGRQVVRVSQEAPTVAAKEKAAGQRKHPDRRAAEYVLFIGGTVKVNDQDEEIKVAVDLPHEAFGLTYARLYENKRVDDEGLAHFKGCKDLTVLDLSGTRFSDAGLANFKDCKDLTELHLVGTKVSDTGLACFKDCKDLKVLDLNWTRVTDVGVAHFQGCKHLTFLCLAHTRVSDAALANFKDCKELTDLSLGDIPISDAGLAHFKGCKKLTHVHLDGTRVSDACLVHFKDCKDLAFLLLYNNPRVSDTGLAHLKSCKKLTELRVQKTKVTAAGIGDLKKALPKCEIEWDGGVTAPR